MKIRFWKAVLVAWIASLFVRHVGRSIVNHDFFRLENSLMELYARAIQENNPLYGFVFLLVISFYLFLPLIAIYCMAKILERIPGRNTFQIIKYSAMFGVIFSISALLQHLDNTFSGLTSMGPPIDLLRVLPVYVLSFIVAGLLYSKIDSN